MKIAILTLPLHTNYGGVLQAWALKRILEKRDYEVVLIDSPEKKASLTEFQKIKIFIKRKVQRPQTVRENFLLVKNSFSTFIDKEFMFRENIESFDYNQFSAFVVGSDQIWRPRYYYKIRNAFLEFLGDDTEIKRISYAPSFGVDTWEYSEEETKACSKLLKKFDYVSCREISGVALIKENLGVDSKHVLDPTLLLDSNDYDSLANESNQNYEGLGISYILDNSKDKDFVKEILGKKYKITFESINKFTNSEDIVGPSDWVKAFKDCEYVITDSFHACVFSIVFNKPFLVYVNESRGASRFLSLLKLFNLENRLVFSSKDISDNIIDSNIDWDSVNELLAKAKQDSLSFLLDSLK